MTLMTRGGVAKRSGLILFWKRATDQRAFEEFLLVFASVF
jgi:hypothetical protein